MKNSKKKVFFSHVTRITQPKNQVPRSKAVLCSPRIDTHTHTDTKVTTVGTLSGFQDFFLQPIIKDRPNIYDFFIFINCKSLTQLYLIVLGDINSRLQPDKANHKYHNTINHISQYIAEYLAWTLNSQIYVVDNMQIMINHSRNGCYKILNSFCISK